MAGNFKIQNKVNLLNRFRGCLIGGAIGDTMGMPGETLSRAKIQQKFEFITKPMPRISRNKIKPAGSWTDDTYLCMLTAKSLIYKKAFDIEDMTKIYIEGLRPEYHMGITATTRRSLELRAAGMDPEKEIKGGKHSGSGSAVRMPPIVMYDFSNTKQLIERAILNTKITHSDIDAIGGAVSIALTLQSIFNENLSKNAILNKLTSNMFDIKSNLAFNFQLVQQLLDRNIDTIEGIDEIGTDGASVRLIPSALFAFLNHPNNFEMTILACVNAGGDTDSRAALAGYLSGAYNGMGVIPGSWVNILADKSTVLDYADKLHDLTNNK